MEINSDTQKITVYVNKDLLKKAKRHTHSNITDTVNKGLEKLALADVYQGLLSMRGMHRFSLDLNELRKDRDEK